MNHKFAVGYEDLEVSRKGTKVVPFDLSRGRVEKREQREKELKDKEKRECTFKPETNETRNREIIQQLLHQDKENIP